MVGEKFNVPPDAQQMDSQNSYDTDDCQHYWDKDFGDDALAGRPSYCLHFASCNFCFSYVQVLRDQNQ